VHDRMTSVRISVGASCSASVIHTCYASCIDVSEGWGNCAGFRQVYLPTYVSTSDNYFVNTLCFQHCCVHTLEVCVYTDNVQFTVRATWCARKISCVLTIVSEHFQAIPRACHNEFVH
jgi:hypothetical protein